MFEEIKKIIKINDVELSIKFGKIARQADASVVTQMGDTIILTTVCVDKSDSEGNNGFLPLSVNYREMFYSAGKIPGGFVKREGKPSEHEILVSRLIDRTIRPSFPKNFFKEVQVVSTVLSYDPDYTPDTLAIISASIALQLSSIPVSDVLSAVRVGMIDDQFVLNPTYNQLKNSKLDLILSGSELFVSMVESESNELDEYQMLDAIKFGHKFIAQTSIDISNFVGNYRKVKMTLNNSDNTLTEYILKNYGERIQTCLNSNTKKDRYSLFAELQSSLYNSYSEKSLFDILKERVNDVSNNTINKPVFSDNKISKSDFNDAFVLAKADIMRKAILNDNIRIDNRSPDDVRNISAEIGFLPRVHGSALFTRGETQAIATTTLGTSIDEQIVDSLHKNSKEQFMLHYTFPSYCVGETSMLKPPGRREIGHGKLAYRALRPMMPNKNEFSHAIRVASEITESNGSSSMATVCGASLSLMDAGVPIKKPVAGIAMGLIKQDEKFVILSDINGDEDALGDMDFKVAGTSDGITALQMDIKIPGITFNILEQALNKASLGRKHILSKMNEVIAQSKTNLSEHAPQIKSIKIPQDKIRELIGPGGKNIKEICESTESKIDINDSGVVTVSAANAVSLANALKSVEMITNSPEVGATVQGQVVKVLPSGAFVKINGYKTDGFIHISEVANKRIEDIQDYLQEGQKVQVKIIGIDNKGKPKLSMKALPQ